MVQSICSKVLGVFTYNKDLKKFTAIQEKIHWALDIEAELANQHHMIEKAEKLSLGLKAFDLKARRDIAEHLIQYKNDFWPEYDENDSNLDWDAVDAGAYDVPVEAFAKVITLLDIEINENKIYCEYDDGDLFGGHRIHAYFDDAYTFVSADV